MIFDQIWNFLTHVSKRAWGAAGTASSLLTVGIAVYFGEHIPPGLQKFAPVIALLLLAFLFSVIFWGTNLWFWWREKNGHIPNRDRPKVIYHAYPYRSESDLGELSRFAHQVFGGDTMSKAVVEHAVEENAAIGLRLANPQGQTVGFLDAFHFTDHVMKEWKQGNISEKKLQPEDFQKIPSEGDTLHLALGAIYIKPRTDKCVAIQFANIGELFLRKSFPKFRKIKLYATIYREDGERMARLYNFTRCKSAEDRGEFAEGHDLMMREIDLSQMPHTVGGGVGGKHVLVEVKGH